MQSRWLAAALAAVLGAGAAAADPTIVDPDGPDGPLDWKLDVQRVLDDSTLSGTSGLAFFGKKEDQEFFALEHKTGRVRHFKKVAGVEVDQGDALDLSVDTCGDRGLMGIALHPSFDPTPTPVTDPPTVRPPQQDWVYVSWFGSADAPGCGPSAAVLHVGRYTWDGTHLVNPTSVFTKDYTADQTTAVGGLVATTLEIKLTPPVTTLPHLYVLIGSLGGDGKLQNHAGGADLDDTSVMIRLDEDGSTSVDNPFNDPDTALPETKDRYFAYGIHDPRGVAVDPAAQTLWFTDYADPGQPYDEIDLMFQASNGGYQPIQGCFKDPKVANSVPDCQKKLPPNLVGGAPNSDYPLFDLAQSNDTPPKPVSTYLNPRFSFEDDAVKPTGVAFGGTEVGPQHRQDLFVGTGDGRLLRFHVEQLRSGLTLTGELADGIAQKGDPNVDPPRPADDLKDVLIATGFAAISALATGVDGSIYVADASGSVWRVFFDAQRDLAVVSVKAPAKISTSAKKPVVSKSIRITVVNNGEVSERIDSHQELMNFLGVTITPTGSSSCTNTLSFDAIDPKYVSPPYSYPIGIKDSGGKLVIDVSVQWTCSPSAAGMPDFETTVHLNPLAIGVVDTHPENDVCFRPPSGTDPGCGAKKGGPIVTDVIQK